MDGTKCDVFSFAILALYVATGSAPYKGLTNEQIVVKIISKQRMTLPEKYAGTDSQDLVRQKAPPVACMCITHIHIGNCRLPPQVASEFDSFVELVQQMWDQEPGKRPGFDTIPGALEKIFKRETNITIDSI